MSVSPLSNFHSPSALARFFLTTIIALALDLWTKSLAEAHLKGAGLKGAGRSIRFIPGWVQFEYVPNHGAVFGIGQGQRWLFILVSVAAIAFLTWLFATSGRQRFYQILLGMLLAGVLGNMYDRAVYGYVRDMIHALPGWPNPFPWLYPEPEIFPWVFNVADSMLCVGVGLMLIYSFLHSAEQEKEGGTQDERARASGAARPNTSGK